MDKSEEALFYNKGNVLFRSIVLGVAWIFVILGIAGLIVRFGSGLRLTNLGNTVPWGVWVAMYIYFIGLSAGSFLLSTLIYVFGVKKFKPLGPLSLWQALICLMLGIVFIWIDLGRMSRFINPIIYFQHRSVLAWEILFYVLYMIILLVELTIVSKLKKTHSNLLKILGIIGIPVAIGVHGGTGAIFAVVKARPYWYTALFPIIFLVSALASGGALLLFARSIMCISSKCDVEENSLLQSLAKLTVGILSFDFLLLLSEFLVGLYGGIPDHIHTYKLITTGPFWWVFWVIQITLGFIVPIIIVGIGKLNNSCSWLGLAGLLIFFGVIGVRLNIVIPALAVAPFSSYTRAYNNIRLQDYYFPSLLEIIVTVGLLSLGTLIFYYGIRFLKLDVGNGLTKNMGKVEG